MITVESLRIEFDGMDIPKCGEEDLLSQARYVDNLFCGWERGDHSDLLREKIEAAFVSLKSDYEACREPSYDFIRETGMQSS